MAHKKIIVQIGERQYTTYAETHLEAVIYAGARHLSKGHEMAEIILVDTETNQTFNYSGIQLTAVSPA